MSERRVTISLEPKRWRGSSVLTWLWAVIAWTWAIILGLLYIAGALR